MSIFKIKSDGIKLKTSDPEVAAMVINHISKERTTIAKAEQLCKDCDDALARHNEMFQPRGVAWHAKTITTEELAKSLGISPEAVTKLEHPLDVINKVREDKGTLALPVSKTKVRKYKGHYQWTEEEMNFIKDGIQDGKKASVIVKEFKKLGSYHTKQAVRRRIWGIKHQNKVATKQLGPAALQKQSANKSLKLGVRRPWTVDEYTTIKQCFANGMKQMDVVRAVKRMSPHRTMAGIISTVYNIKHGYIKGQIKNRQGACGNEITATKQPTFDTVVGPVKRQYIKHGIKPWTTEEDTVILQNMEKKAKEIMPLLNGRDAQSIYDRRWRLRKNIVGSNFGGTEVK